MEVSVTAFLNEITAKHAKDKIVCGNGGNLRKGSFEEIAKKVRNLRNISESVPVNKRTIERHIQRGSMLARQNHGVLLHQYLHAKITLLS